MTTIAFRPMVATVRPTAPQAFRGRYIGSLTEYVGRVGTATPEGCGRYTFVFDTGLPMQTPGTLRNVRRQSIEYVTVVLD